MTGENRRKNLRDEVARATKRCAPPTPFSGWDFSSRVGEGLGLDDVSAEMGLDTLDARPDALRVLFVPAFHDCICVTIDRATPPHVEVRIRTKSGESGAIYEEFVNEGVLQGFDLRTRSAIAKMYEYETVERDGMRIFATFRTDGVDPVVRFDNGEIPPPHREFVDALLSLCELTFRVLPVREAITAIRRYVTNP